MLLSIDAEPAPIAFDPATTALVIIDMQRDFLEPGGFGETLGNDVSLLSAAIGPCRAVLDAARAAGLLVVHTQEGHEPDLGRAAGNVHGENCRFFDDQNVNSAQASGNEGVRCHDPPVTQSKGLRPVAGFSVALADLANGQPLTLAKTA